MTSRILLVILAVATTLCGASVRAQVIEIDASGAAQTYAGPTIFTPDGSVPIERRARNTSARRVTPSMIAETARAHGIDPALLQAVAWQESRGRMSAVSVKGALGVMQLMPGTAAELNVDPLDVSDNIRGGALYLRRQLDRFGGSVPLALAAYNAGPGAVLRFGGIPPYRETRNYVATILGRWRAPPAGPAPSTLMIEAIR
jgi:soluble lytic murein transglycosylase-like protein